MSRRFGTWVRTTIVGAFLLTALGMPLAGQSLGVGYVVNAPDALVGGALYSLFLGEPGARWGLYVDAKLDPTSRSDEVGFIEDMTAEEAESLGDAFFGDDKTWRSVNVAVMRELTPELTAYAGLGWADGTVYNEYFDGDRELGQRGFYWVEDGDLSGSKINALGGVLFRVSTPIRLHVGLESAPPGVTVGASYLFNLGR